jgi:hypothetical protein
MLPVLPAMGQLPLSIEALLMPESTLTLSSRLDWQQSSAPQLRVQALAADGARLTLDERHTERDVWSLGLRYGVSRRLELSALARHERLRWRVPGMAADEARGYAASLGGSWLALPEGGLPAILLDARVDLLSRAALPGASQSAFASLDVGLTAYRSLDPLVLSLSTRWRRSRVDAVQTGSPRQDLLIAPQVNFAVNPQVTLLASFVLRRAHGGDASAQAGRGDTPATALRLGLGYAPDRRSTLFFNARLATSGAVDGAGIDLEWLYRF